MINPGAVATGFKQRVPTLPVIVEGRASGYAFAVIDYGQEHRLIWVVAINASGEVWPAPNPKVRVQAHGTIGRKTVPLATVEPPRIAASS